jgi:tRNA (cmo5U34)-methyltransferase
MPRDTLYKKRRARVAPFLFTADVAKVFDDMLARSIPGYGELIGRQAQLCRRYLQPGSCLLWRMAAEHSPAWPWGSSPT